MPAAAPTASHVSIEPLPQPCVRHAPTIRNHRSRRACMSTLLSGWQSSRGAVAQDDGGRPPASSRSTGAGPTPSSAGNRTSWSCGAAEHSENHYLSFALYKLRLHKAETSPTVQAGESSASETHTDCNGLNEACRTVCRTPVGSLPKKPKPINNKTKRRGRAGGQHWDGGEAAGAQLQCHERRHHAVRLHHRLPAAARGRARPSSSQRLRKKGVHPGYMAPVCIAQQMRNVRIGGGRNFRPCTWTAAKTCSSVMPATRRSRHSRSAKA